MDRYKEEIEAIVSPIRGDERKKNDLRRELWSHFCELVEADHDSGDGLEATCARALARLGTPNELRTAFEESTSWGEGLLVHIDTAMRKNPSESMPRYFLRFTGVPALLLLATPALLVAGLETLTAARGETSVSGVQWLPLLGLWAFLSVWLLLWYFPIMLRLGSVEGVVREYVRGGTGGSRVLLAFVQISGLGLALAIGLSAIAFGILALTGGLGTSSTLVYLYIVPWLLGFIWLTHTAVLPYILLRGTFHSDPIPDWPYGSH